MGTNAMNQEVSMNTDTPRTDAILNLQPNDGFGLEKKQCIAQWYDHSAELERENARLREELATREALYKEQWQRAEQAEKELAEAKRERDEFKETSDELARITDYIMGYWPMEFCFTHPMQAIQHLANEMAKAQHRAEQAEKELAEAKRDYTEKDRQYHMDAINRLASFLAMSGTSFEVVQAAIDNMTRLVAQKNLAIQSAKEWREQKQRADSYALDIEELQEQLRQLNAAYRTETQAKILSDACYENQYQRAEQAEARALEYKTEHAALLGTSQWQETEIADLRDDVKRHMQIASECEERALANEKDAGRYRWLRDKSQTGTASDPCVTVGEFDGMTIYAGEELDTAIDAAIGAKHE